MQFGLPPPSGGHIIKKTVNSKGEYIMFDSPVILTQVAMHTKSAPCALNAIIDLNETKPETLLLASLSEQCRTAVLSLYIPPNTPYKLYVTEGGGVDVSGYQWKNKTLTEKAYTNLLDLVQEYCFMEKRRRKKTEAEDIEQILESSNDEIPSDPMSIVGSDIIDTPSETERVAFNSLPSNASVPKPSIPPSPKQKEASTTPTQVDKSPTPKKRKNVSSPTPQLPHTATTTASTQTPIDQPPITRTSTTTATPVSPPPNDPSKPNVAKSIALLPNPVNAPPKPSAAPPPSDKTKRPLHRYIEVKEFLNMKPGDQRDYDGLSVTEIEVGSGPCAEKGEIVEIEWTMVVKNPPGYFDTERLSKVFKVGDQTIHKGLSMGIYGMCPGGKRIILIPEKYLVEKEGIPRGAVLSYEVVMKQIG